MKLTTIKKLNALNQKFYQNVAEPFNRSRQFYWLGWEKLLPTLKKHFYNNHQLKVLDLGCGNGRFGSFLTENFEQKINYHGLDSNLELLKLAKKRSVNFSFSHSDFIDDLLHHRFLQNFPQNSQDLIVMFGVWHHLPSSKLRQQLLQKITAFLNQNGLLIFTAWQFYELERFKNKIINPELADINPTELETNDYLISWQRGVESHRYCHYSPDSEIQEHLKKSPSIKQIASFSADGEQDRSNNYYILGKNQ